MTDLLCTLGVAFAAADFKDEVCLTSPPCGFAFADEIEFLDAAFFATGEVALFAGVDFFCEVEESEASGF